MFRVMDDISPDRCHGIYQYSEAKHPIGGHSAANRQLDRLTDLLINETINKEVYDRKFAQLQARRKEITVMQEEHQGGNEEFKIALTTMVSLASKAPEIFKSSKTSVKRALMAFVFSNLALNGQKLEYALRPPFDGLQNLRSYKEWLC